MCVCVCVCVCVCFPHSTMMWRTDVFFNQISLRWNFPVRERTLPRPQDLKLRMAWVLYRGIAWMWTHSPVGPPCTPQAHCLLTHLRECSPGPCYSSATGASQGRNSAPSLLQPLLRDTSAAHRRLSVCEAATAPLQRPPPVNLTGSLLAQVGGVLKETSCLPLPTS